MFPHIVADSYMHGQQLIFCKSLLPVSAIDFLHIPPFCRDVYKRQAEDQSRSTQGLNDVITYAVNAEKIRRRQSESMEMELVGEAEELMEQYAFLCGL